jgi:ABC-2 type transport system ATP-binding protein
MVTTGVVRSFDGEIAVAGVDLDVEFGEIHAIVGLNGAGKTTLMRLLLGMLTPDAGRAVVLDEDAATAPAATWSRVAHLIETPFAYRELTVEENLAAAARLHGLVGEDVATAVARSIDEFGLGKWARRRSAVLSLGNRQRLGLASALIHRPAVLILDEPANALDPAGVVFIRDLLRSQAEQGAAILVSSHHLDEIARIAHRITVLHGGAVVGSLDPGGVDLERRFFDIVYEADRSTKAGA